MLLLLVAGLSCLHPPFPEEIGLQHLGTLLLLVILAIDACKGFLTRASFLGLAGIAALHILGARWLYTYVPYNDWSRFLFGIDLNQTFGWQRNHYDRFVHLTYGALIWPVFLQLFSKLKRIAPALSILCAWLLIQCTAMLYELFECLLTLVLSSDAADNYNGQQGDFWDAQKDMALSLISSSLMAAISLLRNLHRRKKHPEELDEQVHTG